jgi:hypothetical protein
MDALRVRVRSVVIVLPMWGGGCFTTSQDALRLINVDESTRRRSVRRVRESEQVDAS